jgi:hypothetical protein
MLLKNRALAFALCVLCSISILSDARCQAPPLSPPIVPLIPPESPSRLTSSFALKQPFDPALAPGTVPSFVANHFASPSKPSLLLLPNARFTRDFGLIDRLEASVTFLDTPFAEQVHLPIASLWGGRLKLRGFESRITTADILWGLPGAGSWSILHMGGRSFYAVRLPQEAQAYGMDLALHLRGGSGEPGDNAVVHGLGRALHAGRDLLHP